MERRMMVKIDEWFRLETFVTALQAIDIQGLDREETAARAAMEVGRWHPVYGDPRDTTHGAGDDRPLPHELKDRVNVYVQRQIQIDLAAFRQRLAGSSSFNALLRHEIREGNL